MVVVELKPCVALARRAFLFLKGISCGFRPLPTVWLALLTKLRGLLNSLLRCSAAQRAECSHPALTTWR